MRLSVEVYRVERWGAWNQRFKPSSDDAPAPAPIANAPHVRNFRRFIAVLV